MKVSAVILTICVQLTKKRLWNVQNETYDEMQMVQMIEMMKWNKKWNLSGFTTVSEATRYPTSTMSCLTVV